MDLYKIAQWTIAAAQEKNKNMAAFVIVEPFYYFFFWGANSFLAFDRVMGYIENFTGQIKTHDEYTMQCKWSAACGGKIIAI